MRRPFSSLSALTIVRCVRPLASICSTVFVSLDDSLAISSPVFVPLFTCPERWLAESNLTKRRREEPPVFRSRKWSSKIQDREVWRDLSNVRYAARGLTCFSRQRGAQRPTARQEAVFHQFSPPRTGIRKGREQDTHLARVRFVNIRLLFVEKKKKRKKKRNKFPRLVCTVYSVTHALTDRQTDRQTERERIQEEISNRTCSKVVSKRNTKKCSPPSPPLSSATTYPLPPSPPSSTSTTRTVVRSPASNTVYGRVTLSRTTSASTNSWIHVASGSRRSPALVHRARCSKDRRYRSSSSISILAHSYTLVLSLSLSLSLYLSISRCLSLWRF